MKNYLVIGGSSGIGKRLVEILIEKGHRVYASYNSTQFENNSEAVTYFKYNVLTDELPIELLPKEINGLVYCPGSIDLKPFRKLTTDDVHKDIDLQVNGAIKIIQSTYKALRQAKASIVLYSTVAVQKGFSFHSQVAISKGAIEGLTRSLAAEFSPQIRVNAVAPSITETPLASKLLNTDEKKARNMENHPLKRIGTPHDIASATAFLLSDDSNWMTGQILHVDGGKSSINS
jgi:NAD(P)-dependent dehydrogenase (short-subunit alcohol dehydrogenase family)